LPTTKKGDNKVCGNFRGISLLSTTYKSLPKILLSNLIPQKWKEKLLGTIGADFGETAQLLIIYSTFLKYLRKM